jgi:hypothetical protein
VFQQIPGQNRIFMGWYSQGTQVVDFTENADGTVDFKEAGYFIPEGANTWVSHVFKVEKNANGTFTYYGATGDFALSGVGRNAIDVYKVTLPGAPTPGGSTTTTTTPATPAAVDACASGLAFRTAGARARGRGLAFGFSRAGRAGVTVDVFRTSKGGRVTGERRVKRFLNRTRNFNWNGRGKGVADGYYVVRFTVRAPNGRKETRRVALVRRNGRFRARPAFSGKDACGLLQSFKLERPVFGGKGRRNLGISFRVSQTARVAITVRRGSKTVKRFAARSRTGGKTYRLRLGAKGLRRGNYRLTLTARRGTTRVTSNLTARRL